MEHCNIKKENYIYHLRGKIQYALFINPYDDELKGYLEYLEKEYSDY